MKKIALLSAALFLLAVATPGITEDASVETLRTDNTAAFDMAAVSIPVTVAAQNKSIRCDARLRWRSSGYHMKCPYGRVVTGVQISGGDLAILSCAEVHVTCRQ